MPARRGVRVSGSRSGHHPRRLGGHVQLRRSARGADPARSDSAMQAPPGWVASPSPPRTRVRRRRPARSAHPGRRLQDRDPVGAGSCPISASTPHPPATQKRQPASRSADQDFRDPTFRHPDVGVLGAKHRPMVPEFCPSFVKPGPWMRRRFSSSVREACRVLLKFG